MAGQMLRRNGADAAPSDAGGSTVSPSEAMSATGTTTSTSSCLRTPASTTVTGRAGGAPPSPGAKPPRNRAISSRGRWVADRAMRWGERSQSSSRRSRDTIRWAPRLLPATAWISSMITCSTPLRVKRAWLVSIRNSDSGVVMRMSGGRLTKRRRSAAEVSPVRTPTVGSRTVVPSRSAASRMPCSGVRRFFSTSTASARNGEMYSTLVAPFGGLGEPSPPDPARSSDGLCELGGPSDMSRSTAHRKAASVLPVPVGAHTSVWSPAAIAGQPWAWGGVGSKNADANQARVGFEKRASGSAATPSPYRPPATAAAGRSVLGYPPGADVNTAIQIETVAAAMVATMT